MVMGIRNNWIAWQFDRAIATYGRHVENKLRETKETANHKIVPRYTLKEIIEGVHEQPDVDVFMMLIAGNVD